MQYPLQAYGAPFIQKIKQKHLLAQNYFSRIPEMADEMKDRVRQMPLPHSKEKEFTVTLNLGGRGSPQEVGDKAEDTLRQSSAGTTQETGLQDTLPLIS